jgi:putative Mn2+ efflux pump MntP
VSTGENIFSILLIALATNLDNLCAAVALGIRQKRIPPAANLAIALISGIVALIASAAASFLLHYISVAGILGGVLIATMGVWTVASAFKRHVEENVQCERLGAKQTILLGCALAINCLPVAFGAGAAGLSCGLTGLFIAAFSFLCMELGALWGGRLGRNLKPVCVNVLSGGLLIILGVLQIFF